MINENELRLGNLFIERETKELIRVIELRKEQIMFSGKFDQGWQAEPIPLNDEWLVKFGFINRVTEHLNYFELKVKSGLFRIEGLDVYFWKGLPSKEWYYDEGRHMPITHRSIKLETKHVHSLQNLYFALTSQELVLKD